MLGFSEPPVLPKKKTSDSLRVVVGLEEKRRKKGMYMIYDWTATTAGEGVVVGAGTRVVEVVVEVARGTPPLMDWRRVPAAATTNSPPALAMASHFLDISYL